VTTKRSTNAEALARLLVSRENAKQQIQVQITQGTKIRNLPIASEKELRDALSEKSKWTSYCTELLSRLFDAQ